MSTPGDRDHDGVPTVRGKPDSAPPPEPGERDRDPAHADPPRASLSAGGQESRYQRGAEIGRGGMGRVIEATDTVLGRTVALKEIRDLDGDLARRFEREVYVTARLEHPSIVPVYDAGRTGTGLPFYVMRRVSGRPLDVLIGEASDLDGRLALIPNLLAAVDAVAHAHRRGVIHRDLKPANVLVGDHGETLVIDWGLAKLVDEEDGPSTARGGGAAVLARDERGAADSLRTRIGTVFGTPGFMPPEQALGDDVDLRGDVYALGATLYHLLAGKPPWSGTGPTEILDRVVAEAPPAVAEVAPGIPRDLAAIVDKAMAHDREHRYPDAGALGDDLRRFMRGQLVAAHRYSRRQRFTRWLRKHRAAIAVGGAAAAALIVLGVLSLTRIVADRDRIALAQAAAVDGERKAVAALAEAEDQKDRLLIETARSAVDRDPTYALTRLAELPAGSKRWPQARAVALAARARGVIVGFEGVGPPWLTTLSPDGNRVAVLGSGGELRVHDLLHRTSFRIDGGDRMTTVAWAGERLAVARGTTITLHDLAGGPSSVVTSPEPVELMRGASSGVLAWRTVTERLFVASAGTTTELPSEKGTTHWFQLAADGRTIATAGPLGLRLYRHAGTGWPVVVRAAGAVNAIELTADSSRLAARFATEIREWLVAGDRVVTRGPWPTGRGGQIQYAGEHLLSFDLGSHTLVDRHADPAIPVLTGIASYPLTLAPIADGAVASLDGAELRLANAARQLVIPLPEFGFHVTARPGVPWVVVTTSAHVLAIDLREVWPVQVAPFTSGEIVGLPPHSLLIDGYSFTRIIDEVTGESQDLPPLPPRRRIDAGDRAVIETAKDGAVAINRLDGAPPQIVPLVGAIDVALRRDALIVGTEAGDVIEQPLAGGPARTLGHLDAPVLAVFDRGDWIAAVADGGMCWRGDRTTGSTTRLSATPQTMSLADDGAVYALIEDDLVHWPPGAATATVLAHLPVPPLGFGVPAPGLITVIGEDRALYRIDVATGRVDSVLPTSRWPIGIAFDGRTATRIADDGNLQVADLVAGEWWSLPTAASNLTAAEPGPDGTAIYGAGGGNGVIRYPADLPRDPATLRAWLVGRTNARAGAQLGVIEWQLPTPARVR